MEEKQDWRGCLKYPQCVDAWAQGEMDTLVYMLPNFPWDGEDRYYMLAEFLRQAESEELIDGPEHQELRSRLAQHI